MCTLIVARGMFENLPLVVAANRDELLTRPSEAPRFRNSLLGIFAPKDLQRGGTWMGINSYRLFVGLTNRLDVKSEPGRISRGDLVIQALHCKSAKQAFELLSSKRGQDFNGFNLVMADKEDAFLFRGDGRRIESTREMSGLLVVTNRGIGRSYVEDSEKTLPPRVRNIFRTWEEKVGTERRPPVGALKALLDIHGGPEQGTCLNEPDENYGTKSSGIIFLETGGGVDRWRYYYRERVAPREHVCVAPFYRVIKYGCF